MGLYNASNVTSVNAIMEYVNSTSNGRFSVGALISLFAIIWLSISATGNIKEGGVAASFITMLTAMLFRIINLIPNYVLIITIIIFFFMTFLLFSNWEGRG